MEKPDCCCSCGSKHVVEAMPRFSDSRLPWNVQYNYREYCCADCGCKTYHYFYGSWDY